MTVIKLLVLGYRDLTHADIINNVVLGTDTMNVFEFIVDLK